MEDSANPALDAAITSYLASRSDTPQLLKQAMAHDPQDLTAACMMGYLLRLAGDLANAQRARGLHRDLCERVAGGAGTARERDHVTALGLWLEDDLPALEAHFETMLAEQPTDVLTLRMLHYLYFYDGDAERMRQSVAQRLADFAGHPLEGYVKGMLAFAHEEAGDYDPAERLGREAVRANPEDIWAAHAVAHVMQMQGRWREGTEWVGELRPHWQHANNFRCHLFWHQALYHLAGNELDAVLEIYDAELAPVIADDFYLDVCNAASLLLRLEALGCAVGTRWQPLAAMAEHHVDDAELVFASLHYLMPLLRTNSPAAVRLMASLEQWAERDSAQGHVVREVALDIARFLQAVQMQDTAAARRLFERFRPRLHRIGGSHAQRELFGILNGAAA